jgi:hypothetical protein
MEAQMAGKRSVARPKISDTARITILRDVLDLDAVRLRLSGIAGGFSLADAEPRQAPPDDRTHATHLRRVLRDAITAEAATLQAIGDRLAALCGPDGGRVMGTSR